MIAAAVLFTATALMGALPEDAPTAAPPAASNAAPAAATAPSGVDLHSSAFAMKATLMETEMRDYLGEEKTESALFFALGALTTAGGVAMLALGSPFFKGAAIPLIAVAIIQMVVGGVVWARTDAQIAALATQLHEAPGAFVDLEGARMAVVNRNFELYRIAEIAFAVIGAGLVGGGFALKSDYLKGIGAGLALQGGLMLTFDFIAESRAHRYSDAIGAFGKRS